MSQLALELGGDLQSSLPNSSTAEGRDKGSWQLSGELTFNSLSSEVAKLQGLRPNKNTWSIDCQNLSKIDSAGVAFLLDCIRFAAQHNLQLKIVHLQGKAQGLMEAQGVAKLFVPYLG